MSLIDINAVETEARAEIAKEEATKAKAALVAKIRQLQTANKVVANIQREIDDLKASIADGSFTS